MDAVKFNQQLDAELAATGVVSRDLYLQFAEAYGYGAASTIGWLEAKLRVLSQRLGSGKSVLLYDPENEAGISCTSTAELAAWASRLFPGVQVGSA